MRFRHHLKVRTVTLLALLVIAACGTDTAVTDAPTTTAAQLTISAGPSCDALAAAIGAEGAPTLQIGGGGQPPSCSLEVRDSAVLQRIGLRSTCPPDVPLMIPFTRDGERWTLDTEQMRTIDGGDCLERAE